MIAWLHTTLVPPASAAAVANDPIFGRGNHEAHNAPAFALGTPGKSVPYLLATPGRTDIHTAHSAAVQEPVLGRGASHTLAPMFRDTVPLLQLVYDTLGHWRSLGTYTGLNAASSFVPAWSLAVLRDGIVLLDCALDDPLAYTQSGESRLNSWFREPCLPDAPSGWRQAHPALLFTIGTPSQSAHARLLQQTRLRQDMAFLAAHLGHASAFTWQHPHPMAP